MVHMDIAAYIEIDTVYSHIIWSDCKTLSSISVLHPIKRIHSLHTYL